MPDPIKATITLVVEETQGANSYTLSETLSDGHKEDPVYALRHFFEDVGVKLVTFEVVPWNQ